MTFKAIERVGVELEGGWNDDHDNCVESECRGECVLQEWSSGRARYKADGSVRSTLAPIVGEVVSPPLETLEGLEEWIGNYYPEETDVSCGLHVHMSFKTPMLLGRCVEEAFCHSLLDDLRAWAKEDHVRSERLQRRLNGDNSFCRTQFNGYEILGDPDRYRAVNYAAYLKHGTLEIRVLPMFQMPVVAVGAVRRVVEFTDRWASDGEVAKRSDLPINRLVLARRRLSTPRSQKVKVIRWGGY